MTFERLVNKLNKFSFEEIINKYNALFGTKYKMEFNGSDIVYNEELEDFFDTIGAEITDYNCGYALIKTINGKAYEIPYEEAKGKTILKFSPDTIYDVSNNLGSKII